MVLTCAVWRKDFGKQQAPCKEKTMGTIQLPYGNTNIRLCLREGSNTRIYMPNKPSVLVNPLEKARAVLRAPNGAKPLKDLLREKNPQKILIVVNDETRPTPYAAFFPPILEVFAECGIPDEHVTFLIATGLHKAHDEALNIKTYGPEMVRRFRFVSHEAEDKDMLVNLGPLPSGVPLEINRLAVESDFLITLGVVAPHYFAGFSGGRKSILPGIAGHETVEKNHARMLEIIDNLPEIHKNPVSLEMIWGARKLGVDFILNAVVTDDQEIVHISGGNMEAAWYECAEISHNLYAVPFDEYADLCIVSASGYPRDVNMYQSQKALEHADRITRDGGRIVMLSESPQGFGEPVFEEWMSKGMPPREIMEKISRHFIMGGHKAYGFARVAAHKKLTFISSLTKENTGKLFADKSDNIQALYDAFLDDNPQASVAILPQGSVMLPVHSALSSFGSRAG